MTLVHFGVKRHMWLGLSTGFFLAVVTIGCLGSNSGEPSMEGPLKISGGGAGLLTKWPNKPVTATFGGVFPCIDGGGEITILDVAFHPAIADMQVTSALRIIPPVEARDEGTSWAKWAPLSAAYGDPNQLLRRGRIGGEILTSSAGQTVYVDCERAPDGRLVELLTVIRSTEAGALSRNQTIAYSFEGSDYVARVNWMFGICGPQVRRLGCRG